MEGDGLCSWTPASKMRRRVRPEVQTPREHFEGNLRSIVCRPSGTGIRG